MDRYGVYGPAPQLAMFKREASPPEAPVDVFAKRARAIRSLDGKFRLDECTIAVVPSTLHHAGRASLSSPNIGSGEAADIGASRRPSQLKRPFLARTPARPDWANLDRKPPAETRAVFVVLSARW